ncbi:MAG: hypothetical protein M1812_006863 [Candelaria pacifica]|nr:MAG: hypothetical protein M1812_006863 [Candelaria pacifica]
MTSDQDLDLTIGIELEFVFAADRSFWEAEAYKNKISCVSKLLQNQVGNRLEVEFYTSYHSNTLVYDTDNTWTVHAETALVDENAANAHFENFKSRSATLKEVVAPEINQLLHWRHLLGDPARKRLALEKIAIHTDMMHGVEIVSPILQLSDIANWSQVLLGIEDTLLNIPLSDPLNTEYTAWTPEKTGMHVHIALSQSEHLSFGTLQNLIAIWGCFEKQLNRLQPAHRPLNTHCKSLWLGCPSDASYAKFCRRIYHARDIPHLATRVNKSTDKMEDSVADGTEAPRYTRINLQNLVRAIDIATDSYDDYDQALYDAIFENKAKITIEFREHAGTLKEEDVRWWVLLIASVVRFAERVDKQGLRWGVEGKLDIEDLWKMVGFEEAGREFYRKRMEEFRRGFM